MKLRLALRESLHNWRFSLAFVANLSLGLFGFVLLSAFHGSVQESFEARSRALLTADLAVSARRELTEEEQGALSRALGDSGVVSPVRTRSIELYSMATSARGTRLAELIAIENDYPLYGELLLEGAGQASPAELLGGPKIWISPELSVQMGLRPGDSLKIGELRFVVSGIIRQDASTGWRGFSFAPRLYLGLSQLEKTGLVRKGSTASFSHYFKFDPGTDVEALARELNRALPDPGIRVTTHRSAGEQMSRLLTYLGDYLGLVALVGLFLASLGGAYLFQSSLSRRLGGIATLISLGVPHSGAILVYVFQMLILGTSASVLAILASWAALPWAATLLERHLDFTLTLSFARLLPSVGAALAGGMAGSVLVCLPLAARIRTLKPALLFQESATATLGWDRASAVSAIPGAVFLFLISVWQSHSWRVGSVFSLGFAASAAILALGAGLLLRLMGKIPERGGLSLALSLRYLSRNRLSTVSAFVAIGLGSLLINLLPQLQRNIESEIRNPEVSSVPSLFLFDIQDEQVPGMEKLLGAEGVRVMQSSPLIRARLEAVNGKPFEKPIESRERGTREEEQEARSRNRGFNLSYREGLSESETLVRGGLFTGRFEGATASGGALPGISLEEQFASRLGLGLGDELRFDVQGVPVSGRVQSLRKVRWTSFQPNFFVQFQPGALDDAPKTHLITVQKLGIEERVRLQNRIVESFPNVSIIDVSQVVERLVKVFAQMSWALQLMAALSVLTGLVVLFSIVSHQARLRQSEVQLLKILGCGQGDVARVFGIEFGAIGLLAALAGVFVSTGVSYVISARLFDWAWSFSPLLPLATVAAVTLLSVLTTQLAAFRTLRLKPTIHLEAT